NGTTSCPRIFNQNPIVPRTFDGLTFCNPRERVFASDPDTTTQTINVVVTTVLTDVPRFGNSPRNGFRGARQEYFDASLFKSLHVAERLNLQFRIQAYNVFNHLNGYRPVNNLSDSNFGRDTSEQRRRQLEFGLRIIL